MPNYKHGASANGRMSPTYQTWTAMKGRCGNPDNPAFVRYGAAGIVVCERWRDSYAAFLADMGERPEGTSIDRIDNSKGYEPGNCRWATCTEQSRNRKNSRLEAHEPAQIRWLASEGYRQCDIARFFEVTQTLVSQVVLGKTWREVAHV